ncbi:hypothetical protein BJX64DRAFT_91342 [Aspergillus heterothallicus]
MLLQFVEQGSNGIRGADRRVIRSHVMQGKNKGRPRRSTKKQKHVEIKRPFTAPEGIYKISRPILWGDFCLGSFPADLDSTSIALMHRWFFDISDALFPPQFCSKFDIIQSIWVNCILADEAYFHSTLAISASYIDFVQRKPSVSSQTLYHISEAYSLVNAKLSGPLPVSDSAIAAVVSLAIYQQVHGQPQTGLVHLTGLCRMIAMRGGISKLMQENRALALKPLRLDVELAIQTGTHTLFRGGEVPIGPILCRPSGCNGQLSLATAWMPLGMLHLLNFSALLNGAEMERIPKLDPLDFTETLIWLVYFLLESMSLLKASAPLGAECSTLPHLAMLAFMTTLLPEYTREGYGSSLLAKRIEVALENIHTTPPELWDLEPTFLLWILVITTISVCDSRDQVCVRGLIVATCERLRLDDWTAVNKQLTLFPWIYALHNAPARQLWEDITATTPM